MLTPKTYLSLWKNETQNLEDLRYHKNLVGSTFISHNSVNTKLRFCIKKSVFFMSNVQPILQLINHGKSDNILFYSSLTTADVVPSYSSYRDFPWHARNASNYCLVCSCMPKSLKRNVMVPHALSSTSCWIDCCSNVENIVMPILCWLFQT